MAGYQYRGKLRGVNDPWSTEEATKPEPKPKSVKRKPQKPRKDHAPCGTKAAHKRHVYNGETPCGPCREAKAEYDRRWRAGQTGVAA